jgi:hypothetical protein
MADDAGVTVPAPFSIIVTFVAVPPKMLPLTVTGVVPQVAPVLLLRVKVGGLTHPHETEKRGPIVVHPAAFLTTIIWLPFPTPEKLGLV